MPKVNAQPGFPLLHFWVRLRDNGVGAAPNTGTAASQLLGRHPRVREHIRTFIGSDSALNFSNNPGDTTDNTRAQTVAQRLRERLQDEVARGADPASVAFFIQKFGGDSGLTTTGADMHRAPDDAVDIATEAQGYNSISTAKAINGTMTVQTRVPWATLSAAIRDAFKIELQNHSLAPPGIWLGDTEEQPEPWQWCKTAGGSWTANANAAFAGTETILKTTHFVVPAYAVADGDPEPSKANPGNLTLTAWIARAVARTPGFAPSSSVNWSTGANASSGSSLEMARLRSELKASQYAALTTDIWKTDAFWEDLQIVNYEQSINDNPRMPVTPFASGGSGGVDHAREYNGLDGSSPVLYPESLANFPTRFSAVSRTGPGRVYDEAALFGGFRSAFSSIRGSSLPNSPIIPWVRSIDATTGSAPTTTVLDMARSIRFCASYPSCKDIEVWGNDALGPNYPAMIEAVRLACPEWRPTTNNLDWEAA